jgi:hypothetical protein
MLYKDLQPPARLGQTSWSSFPRQKSDIHKMNHHVTFDNHFWGLSISLGVIDNVIALLEEPRIKNTFYEFVLRLGLSGDFLRRGNGKESCFAF